MQNINLRDLYPNQYTAGYFIEIPDHLAQELHQFELDEASYRLRTYRHQAYYSLDRGDGIENEVLFVASTPDELYQTHPCLLFHGYGRICNCQGRRGQPTSRTLLH